MTIFICTYILSYIITNKYCHYISSHIMRRTFPCIMKNTLSCIREIFVVIIHRLV